MDRRGSCVGWGVIFFLNVSGLNFFFFFFFSSFINGVISMEYRIQERYLSSSLFYYPSGRFLFPGGAILSFPFMIIPGRKQISTTS
ncbi:hypothetical protein FCZ59_24630 [Escherichia coli]|nr:hypothetical protein [Escherichia coli]